MNRQELILAALSAAGQDASFTPVQVQKLFFLLDREAAHLVGGPHFAFKPYDYGPFDRDIYSELDALCVMDLAVLRNSDRIRRYALSQKGHVRGTEILDGLHGETKQYLTAISTWVRSLSFQQLVSAIYKRHPDMKVNSVFQE